MIKTTCLIFGLSLMFPFAGTSATVQEVLLGCEKKICFIDFKFAKGESLPSFYQLYSPDKKIYTIGFSETQTSIIPGAITGLESFVHSLQVRETQSRSGTRLLNFDFSTGGLIINEDNRTELKKNNVFRIILPPSPSLNSKKWSFSQDEKKLKANSAKVDAKTSADKKAEVVSPSAVSEKPKTFKIAEDKKAADVVVPQNSTASQLIKIGYTKTAFYEKLYMEFSNPPRSEFVRFKGSAFEYGFEGKGFTDKKSLGIQGSSIAKSIEFEEKSGRMNIKLQGVFQKEVRHFIEGNFLVFVRSQKSEGAQLAIWSYDKSGESSKSFKLATPEDEKLGFNEFVKEQKKSNKVSSSKVFTLGESFRPLFITSESSSFLKAAESGAEVLAPLKFGDRLQRITVKGEFFEVKFEGQTGFVSKADASYSDELSGLESKRLKELALIQVNQQKEDAKAGEQNTGTTNPTDSAAANSEAAPLNIEFEKEKEDKIIYSSFGRRDPFIQLEGPSDDGINIDGVELVGIIWSASDPMVLLNDIRKKGVSYTLKEGDKILNGKVLKITPQEVLFLIHEFGVSRRYTMALPKGDD
jgi:hypothetical protein